MGLFLGSIREVETGRVVMQVSAQSWENLELYLDGHPEWELVEGHEELAPPLPSLEDIRIERNRLLNEYGWTVREDSPLSPESKAEWLAYLQALHAVTVGLDDPAAVVWPEKPSGYSYA